MTVHASITSELERARSAMSADDEHWTRLACGQDTEEAEESGRLAGYVEGLEAAVKLIGESHVTAPRDDIAAIVYYCWDDEKRDYAECEEEGNGNETEGHIFIALQRVRAWLDGEAASALFVHEVGVEGRNSYLFADFGNAQEFVAAVKGAGGAASDPVEHMVLSEEAARDVIRDEASDELRQCERCRQPIDEYATGLTLCAACGGHDGS